MAARPQNQAEPPLNFQLGSVHPQKLSLGPQNILIQAERYSKDVKASPFNYRGFRVPFLYSTNGEVIWHHDIRHKLNRSREIFGFHTPEAHLELMARNFEADCDKLLTTPNDHPLIRDYQKEANAATENAIAERKPAMLIAMETGTGKSFMLVNEIYRLIKSGVTKRVLFLVDRRALAAQVVKAFASFEAEPGLKFSQIYEVYHQQFHKDDLEEDEKWDPKVLPKGYLRHPKPGHAFVYVSTIQRMTINLFGRNVIPDLSGDEEIEGESKRSQSPSTVSTSSSRTSATAATPRRKPRSGARRWTIRCKDRPDRDHCLAHNLVFPGCRLSVRVRARRP